MLSKMNSQTRWLIVFNFIILLTILSSTEIDSSKTEYQATSNDRVIVNQAEQAEAPQIQRETAINEIREDLSLHKGKVQVASSGKMQQDEHAETMAKNYKAVEVTATGYSPGRESTGKDPGHPEYGITFSGIKVLRDSNTISTIAADLKLFPLGTIMYIPGYGYGIVADIGSAIKGNIIDLYFDSKEDVYNQWGKKKLEVYVIEQGSGKITEEMFKEKIKAYQN